MSNAPAWWPPKIGDVVLGVWGPAKEQSKDPTYRVVNVFKHNNQYHVVTATRFNYRWHYEIWHESSAIIGRLRPEGTRRNDSDSS